MFANLNIDFHISSGTFQTTGRVHFCWKMIWTLVYPWDVLVPVILFLVFEGV